MKPRNSQFDHDRTPVSEQAALWWITLHSEDCTAADRAAFAEWVARSPQRVEAYLRMSALGSALGSAKVHWPDTSAASLIAAARTTATPVIAIKSPVRASGKPERSFSSWSRRMWYASLAAMLIVGIAVWHLSLPDRYQTRLGEQRSVLLQDGSLVTLNTSSEIEVSFSKRLRSIHLVRGEALFQVAHEAQRPFDVATDNVTIRAVGTQFNVDQRADRTTVTVVEGTVRMSTLAQGFAGGRAASDDPQRPAKFVTAAERVVITKQGMSAPERVNNIVPVTAWLQRQFIFEDRPLREVAEEFNRYNRQQILIHSSQLETQHVTGVFQANDTTALLAFLAGIPGVRIEATEQGHQVVTLDSPGVAGSEAPD